MTVLYDPIAGHDDGAGNTYVAILPPLLELIEAFQFLLDAQAAAVRNSPGPEGEARKVVIAGIIAQTESRINTAAGVTAAEATTLIRDAIEATRVRPGGTGDMSSAIRSGPIATALAGGGVGVADKDELDKLVGKGSNPGPYWRVQELGSTHMVGRELYGLFEPGAAPASQAQNRVHEIFVVGQGPKMVIQHEVQARRFIESGAYAADATRMRLIADAVKPANLELREVIAGTHPKLQAARRVVSKRGRRP